MSALKTFRIKRKLAKKMKQNRPIPQWIRQVFQVPPRPFPPNICLAGWRLTTPSATTPREGTGGAPSSDCRPHGNLLPSRPGQDGWSDSIFWIQLKNKNIAQIWSSISFLLLKLFFWRKLSLGVVTCTEFILLVLAVLAGWTERLHFIAKRIFWHGGLLISSGYNYVLSSEVLYRVNPSVKLSWCILLSSSYCRKFSPRLLFEKDIHTARNCCCWTLPARAEFDILTPNTSAVGLSWSCCKQDYSYWGL